ncbi:MAG: 23S rRNA (guanosine(2251)-2'-O)-methyltransferase RlmB [Eubacteriales bacterium]|nr:23S rRNA (guanosine(2251)-2'-O)-methyltransferase RlmB [Eubacteriales bacterium]
MGKNYKKNENNHKKLYSPAKDGTIRISGYNAVLEKLKAGNPVQEILLQKGAEHTEIVERADLAKVPIRVVEKEELDRYTEERHQGVVAIAKDYRYVEVEDILEIAAAKGEPPFLVLLDQITDPHNLGAIIRTAHQVGCHGIVIPERRSASITEVVAKTSAGAIEYLPVAQVTNLNRTIEYLKKQGLWIAGADMDGQSIYEADLKGAFALVIGSEGEGISRLTREKCDFIVSIPMFGKIDSLNASVSAGVILYEALRQRRFSK